VWAIKYSPQGDKFTSGDNDNIIRVWSKDGKLLIEIKGHDSSVLSHGDVVVLVQGWRMHFLSSLAHSIALSENGN
jgi:WD40 repeat protein